MKVHISEKNMKLGRIPNVSLPPIETCIENPPCAKLCYARKAYDGYGRHNVKPAWDENLQVYRENRGFYFGSIGRYIEEHKSKFFRWHVGGDIPDMEYLKWMRLVAADCPNTQFLTYSRREWAWGRGPDNFVVLRSYWLDEPIGEEAGFVVVPKWAVIPTGVACPGKCSTCHACWNLRRGEHIFTHLH